MRRLAVVIPARNEAERIANVVAELPQQLSGVEQVSVLVVDDGSGDDTSRAARAAGAQVVRHRLNLGKGAALRTGCEVAISAGADLIAVMDADGQHRPSDLSRIAAPLIAGTADLVLTYRTFAGTMPPAMRLGNWGLSGAFGLLYGRRFRDTQCGLRAFTRDAYARLAWDSAGYAVETEMLVRASRSNLRIVEVPIETVYHDRYKGTTPTDGARILADMVRWVLDRRGSARQ